MPDEVHKVHAPAAPPVLWPRYLAGTCPGTFCIVCRRVRARTVGGKFALVAAGESAARGRAYFDATPLAWPAPFAEMGIYGQQMRHRAREDAAYASKTPMRSTAVSLSPTTAPLAHRQHVQAARNRDGGLPCTGLIFPVSRAAACGDRLGTLALDNYELLLQHVCALSHRRPDGGLGASGPDTRPPYAPKAPIPLRINWATWI